MAKKHFSLSRVMQTVVAAAAVFCMSGCFFDYVVSKPAGYTPPVGTKPGNVDSSDALRANPGMELAVFAGGSFWPIESAMREVPGVTATAVGFTGGGTLKPTTKDVGTGTTGHAEAVLVEFDPKKVTYTTLLEKFFQVHDPTTLNQQGADHGTEFRSAIFTFSDVQETAAQDMVRKLQVETGKQIVTEISDAKKFWLAEDYHQQYHSKTGSIPRPAPEWRR